MDEKSEEHREEFTILVRELKNAFRMDQYQLSVTLNPNVNSSLYIDVPAIISYVDFINVWAFDFQTPARNPKEADFPSPIYTPSERNPEYNADYQVTNLISRQAPPNKLVLGIPTYGRGWKITDKDATQTGVPPIVTDGQTEPAPQSKEPGLFSYAEVCTQILSPANKEKKGEDAPYRKVNDPSKRFGTYAYRLPDKDGNFGLWIGFEDPATVGNKAAFARAKGLGGISMVDLSKDDFRGTCTGEKYPILTEARKRFV